MLFSWFDAREAENFGQTLAQFLFERIPPSTAEKPAKSAKPGKKDKPNINAKQSAVIEKLFLQIAVFKLNNKLNMYKKAKLGNTFKWELLDKGYEPQFVDAITKNLMLRL